MKGIVALYRSSLAALELNHLLDLLLVEQLTCVMVLTLPYPEEPLLSTAKACAPPAVKKRTKKGHSLSHQQASTG